MPDRPHDILVQGLDAIRLTREFIDEVTEFDMAAAGDFLDVKFYGQPITERYRAQCATALGQELDRHAVRNVTRRARLIPEAVERHIDRRLRAEPRWNKSTIERVNLFNNGVTGAVKTRNPYFYWQWDRTSIASTLNSERPWDDEQSFKPSHVMAPLAMAAGAAIAVVAGGLAVRAAWKWFTSPPSMVDTSYYTTQRALLPLQQHISNAIDHRVQETMSQVTSSLSTGISSALCAIQDGIRETNTLTQSTMRLVEEHTKLQQITLMEGVKLWILSLLSPR